MIEKYLFKDWETLYHIAICATISFLALFIFIRISGKRTLAKLNAFDFVVSVTLGSTLSSMMLLKTTVAEGCAALIIIIVLQYLLAYFAKKSTNLEKVINSTPSLLFYNGKFVEDVMKRELITEEEIYAEIRKYRIENVADVRAVVMELNGELTVIKKSNDGAVNTSLEDLPKQIR
ncbi:MAG: DUF421 domain-containing protein [Pedobacter sp.]|nr:MAG: DUF421 domain-containing protein [Pedobacter sp.]